MTARKLFHDSVTALPPQPGVTPHGFLSHAAESDHLEEILHLHFTLGDANKEVELERRVAAGEIVDATTLKTTFGADAADSQRLKDWLRQAGFTIDGESDDHRSVYASAPAKTVASALQVDFVRVARDGISYTSARNAPSLPSDIGASVQHIGGLQPFLHAGKHLRGPVAVPALGPTASAQLHPPYVPSNIIHAYGGAGLKLDGSGQGIAILIDTLPLDTDLQAFWTKAGVNGNLARVKKVNVTGRPLPAPTGEESLDAEWTTGIAPGANVSIYATATLQFSDLDSGLQAILRDASADPTLRILSISLGLSELLTPPAVIQSQHALFLRLAALGVNVLVSSGDDGSNPQGKGLAVEYPASDPLVLAVGGTSLRLSTSSQRLRETAWTGSGGGNSVRFPKSSWQVGPGVPANVSGRLVPDVSSVADPNTGALVFVNGQASQIGGTSWSAPTWAGFVAWINQARAQAQPPKKPVPPLASQLYPLNPALHPGTFFDVVAGTNGQYRAGPGYDEVTGLGSPVLGQLVAKLS